MVALALLALAAVHPGIFFPKLQKPKKQSGVENGVAQEGKTHYDSSGSEDVAVASEH
jgi:hypothetical protein